MIPYLLAAILPLSGGCSQAPRQEPVETAAAAYDDSVYCFNGRSIVSCKGMWGLVDQDGRVILKPEWDGIEFLDDDVALLHRAGLYYLCTRDGRFFAEDADAGVLEESFRELLVEMEYEDSRKWDSVLDRLEALCDACIASGRKRPDRIVLEEKAALQAELASVSGQMSSLQKERLEQIVERFKSSYRR